MRLSDVKKKLCKTHRIPRAAPREILRFTQNRPGKEKIYRFERKIVSFDFRTSKSVKNYRIQLKINILFCLSFH